MKEYKYGVVAGKFRILHKAHKEFLINAITENIEELHIIICNSNKYERYSTINELQQAISEILRDYKTPYYFHIYNEDKQPTVDDANEEWDKQVVEYIIETRANSLDNDGILAGINYYKNPSIYDEIVKNIVIYNSKETYQNTLIDNKFLQISQKTSISATEVEENPYRENNYSNIAPEFARYLNKKYVISGVESSGKTEMCKRLSAIFDTSFSEEVGRFYSNDYLGGGEYYEGFYEPKDFPLIAMKQIVQDKDTNLKSNRMIFLDSDPVVTLRFLYFYRDYYIKNDLWNDRLESEVSNAEYLLKTLIKTYKVDKVFLLEPATFVNDGTRIPLKETERWEQFKILKGLYDEFNIPYETISFNGNYTERLNNVIKSIQKELNIMEGK